MAAITTVCIGGYGFSVKNSPRWKAFDVGSFFSSSPSCFPPRLEESSFPEVLLVRQNVRFIAVRHVEYECQTGLYNGCGVVFVHQVGKKRKVFLPSAPSLVLLLLFLLLQLLIVQIVLVSSVFIILVVVFFIVGRCCRRPRISFWSLLWSSWWYCWLSSSLLLFGAAAWRLIVVLLACCNMCGWKNR